MTSIRVAHLCSLVSSLLLVACGAAVEPWPALSADGQPADLACFEAATAPADGDTETIAAPVVPFGAPPSVTVPGVPVRFFVGGPVTAACEPPGCLASMTDGDGVASAELPRGGWVTTEVPAIEGPTRQQSLVRTLEQHWVAGGEETINTFSLATLDGFEETLGESLDSANGIVAGRVIDCAGQPVQHAQLRFFDEAGEELGADLRPLYFDGNQPPALAPLADETAADGRYASIQVPPTATRVEAWGSVGESAPSLLSCESVQVEPSTLTVLVLGPLRADAPAFCRR